ncbi:hypothetical protein FQA39_LY14382 [Lamprigera yunnana]|nr:hypothetical protein FQA39_LY14382 [Lamprigera yunnana]
MNKFLAFVALLAIAGAAVVPDTEFDPHPKYTFDYKVADPITGDVKSQMESRDGDIVKGKYTMMEADGSERVVEYFADGINGFNAVVTNSLTGAVAHGLARSGPIPAAPVVPEVKAVSAKISTPYNYGQFGHPYFGHNNYYQPYSGYPHHTGYYPWY